MSWGNMKKELEYSSQWTIGDVMRCLKKGILFQWYATLSKVSCDIYGM